jgi:hypothetical protein
MKTTLCRQRAKSFCLLRSGNKTGSNPAKSSPSNVSIVANTDSDGARSRRTKASSIGCSPVPRRAFSFPSSRNRPTRCEISVDANVLSEPTKKLPMPKWSNGCAPTNVKSPSIRSSSVSCASAFSCCPNGRRRTSLERWFDAGVQRAGCAQCAYHTGGCNAENHCDCKRHNAEGILLRSVCRDGRGF